MEANQKNTRDHLINTAVRKARAGDISAPGFGTDVGVSGDAQDVTVTDGLHSYHGFILDVDTLDDPYCLWI